MHSYFLCTMFVSKLLFIICGSEINQNQKSNLIYVRLAIREARVYNLSDDETWKIQLIKEISLVKKEHLEIAFDDEDFEEILMCICTD